MQKEDQKPISDEYNRCANCLRAFRQLLNQQYSDSDDGVDRTLETQLPLHRLRRTRAFLHPTFVALRKSAERGCPLCKRINQPLLSQISSQRYKIDFEGPVYLERVWENFRPGDRYCRSHIAVPGLGQSFLSLLDEPSWLADFPLDEWQENDHLWLHKRKVSAANVAPLERVQRWLTDCTEEHEKCHGAHKATEEFMPTRLLQVRSDNDEIIVRLISSSTLEDRVPYVTLSYMWGKENAWGGKIKHVTTTKENYNTYCEAIDYAMLPLTFQDAIRLTLGTRFNYIWIDALCIIQPSENDSTDWDVEASKMRDVYACSALTIAAASAPTVHDGLYISPRDFKFRAESCRVDDLFHDDHWLSKGKLHHHEIWINPRDQLWEDSVIDSPLSSRGWVLQERLFSKRTIFMAQECVFWQCQQVQASEQRPSGFSETSASDVTLRTIESEGFSLERWYSLLRVYSYKSLTEMKDKLPAFAGIAKSFGDAGIGAYLAGLWDRDLARGLLWFTDVSEFEWTSKNLAKQRIAGPPTWSWASIPTQATHDWPVEESLSGQLGFQSKIQVQNTEVQSLGPDMFGRVSGGSLTLSGHMLSFKQRKLDLSEMGTIINQTGLIDGNNSKAILYFDEMRFMNDDAVFTDSEQQLQCLQIGETKGNSSLEDSRRYYLALERDTKHGKDVYRRIGLVVQILGSTRKRRRQQPQQQLQTETIQTQIVLM